MVLVGLLELGLGGMLLELLLLTQGMLLVEWLLLVLLLLLLLVSTVGTLGMLGATGRKQT